MDVLSVKILTGSDLYRNGCNKITQKGYLKTTWLDGVKKDMNKFWSFSRKCRGLEQMKGQPAKPDSGGKRPFSWHVHCEPKKNVAVHLSS